MLVTPLVNPIKLRCKRCAKFRSPNEFIHDAVIGYCFHCYEWHRAALDAFTGIPPKGCQECGRTYRELEDLGALANDGRGDVRFGFHPKDGVYQVLGVVCGCSRRYENQRKDLYLTAQ